MGVEDTVPNQGSGEEAREGEDVGDGVDIFMWGGGKSGAYGGWYRMRKRRAAWGQSAIRMSAHEWSDIPQIHLNMEI